MKHLKMKIPLEKWGFPANQNYFPGVTRVLQEMAKQIPPPLLPMLKRLVEAAEEVNGSGTSTEEKPKVTREVIQK